jgi:hypothetical protein
MYNIEIFSQVYLIKQFIQRINTLSPVKCVTLQKTSYENHKRHSRTNALYLN